MNALSLSLCIFSLSFFSFFYLSNPTLYPETAIIMNREIEELWILDYYEVNLYIEYRSNETHIVYFISLSTIYLLIRFSCHIILYTIYSNDLTYPVFHFVICLCVFMIYVSHSFNNNVKSIL